ncbi:supervillin isoform X3 [Cloeon dipterum]|uniref:supervillin isoform X3 n=1 Tax=Cloeon dipterum TaxID=197152 RepID=UPI00321FD9D6
MYLMQTVSHPPVPRNKLITVMDPPIEAVKKQKTKWTLGSLFRRRTTNKQQQEAAESSSEEEADKKQHQRSFLSHRRSSRKRSERKAKEKSAKIKIEQQPWSGSANSLAGSSEGFGSHSSLSRRDRRELVKARVEATRRDSSSDDNDFTLHQSSSLTRFKSDDSLSSLNRRTRAARTERYMKRMEKSSESSEYHPANNATWNATVVSYRETSPFVRAVSATPSPVVSPKMAHRPLPPQMMSPPRSRRSYCCEQPPPFMPRNNPTPQLYASSAFLPFSPKQAPPPPPRDPQRRFMGTPQQYANVEAKPVYRSRSDHQLPQGDYANTSIFPSSSQTQFKYLADRTPRSRRPIHVIPVHEQSPECILPTPPAWLNEPPQPAKKQSTSPPIRRVSSIEVTLRTPSKTPPPPPVRRYSRQSSVSSVEDEMPKVHAKPVMVTASTNLEDALNELEEIYQSLQLGDEDLLDRAERRDLPTAFQLKRASSVDVSDDGIVLKRTSRAPPLRRSGIPDLVTDDMAYRRLKNPTTGPPAKDRTSGSYLLVSPALSPIPVQTLDPEEPNTTFDDMSYRAIKDANLMGNKVLDPQPPFGIPLTPAPPAANSDYLHAKPTDKYRSTFRPRKTPDLVNDDLAFRNLRKDNNKVGELKHKRAVRSLSANLMNLMEQRDEIEKTQSLGNLPESLQVLLEGSELRSSPGSRPPPSWVERAHLLDTSTETLTQSRANLRSLRNSFLSSDAESRPLSLFVPSNQISPIKEVETAVPANASTDYSEQFDEERLEELLSALAQEAQDTSEKLGKELERLRDGSHSVEDLTKSPTFYQGNQCAALKFEPVSLNATSCYLPVYNHTECETNLPKALHEDINNNSKMKFETEQAPESLSSSEPDEINVDLAEIECNGSQFVAPEKINSTESPRSRTISMQSELCTIHEEFHREEDLDIEDISVEIVTESESIQADIEESVQSESKDYNMVAEVASEINDIEINEEENIEDSSLSSSEEIEDDEACTRFGVPKLNFDNLNENAEYEEADFETIFNESFSDDKKEEAVLAYEKLSSDITVESANNALTCELVHVSSENNSLCLSSNNSSLLTLNTESNLKLSETISDTSLIVPDATIASPETFSESSVPDMVQLTEVDQASDYSDDLSDKTIEPHGLERLDDENVTDEVEKNETEVNESIEEAEQFSLTDHSTLLLPLLQMAREENNKSSSTFQRTVEKLDALIAAASTDIDAPCDFENNNCKGGKDEPVAEDDREAGHRSPSIRNVFQVAEPCVEAMNSQIKASEKRRLMSVNLNGSPSKVDKSDSTSPSSSGLDNGEKSPTKRPQRKSAELSQIRTTRTSRLRAAAANASSPSSDSALSDNKPTARLKSTVPPVRKLLVDYPDSSSSSREGTPLGKNIAKLDETGDKSAKRKSVLNKANAEKLSSGESTTDDGSSRLKNRMAPSPKSSTTCRSLRPTSNQPSSSQNLRNASDPAKVESKKIIEVGKSELSKRADNLLARYKECDSRLDNLAARKASRNKAAPMAKKILHSATKENEKNIDKARAKDEVEEEEAPKKILAPNNSSEKSSAGNSAANSRQSPVKERKTSILKKKSMDDATGPVSILKHEVASSVQPSVSVKAPSPRPQSILKKKSSVDEPSCEERSGEEFEDEPQGILKRKSSTSNKGKMHTILKKKSSEELLPEDLVEPRPILKKRASTDDEVLSSNESEKPRPILKSGRRSAEGDESNYSSANSSPVRRSPSVKVEEGVIRNQVNLTLRFNQQADQEDGPFESACLSASEDENSRRGPSVSERAQLFMRLQEMHRLPSNDTPSTSKGFATSSGDDLPPMVTTRRERAKRFSTQPVTSEEVDEAKSQISVGPEPISIPTPATMTGDSDDEEEEPSSLSLAERVRLFTQKIEQQNRQPKEGQPVQKRTVKKQVTSTRFRTLPVTDAEVEGFSNTLGTRHQPSGLDGLVARAVMETSRSDPIDVDPRPRGILKHCSSMGSNSYPPLSTEPLIPPEETDIVRGILKIPASVIANALGSQQQSAFTSSFKSALKKESSTDERSNQSPTRSILKTGKAEEWTESSSEEEINSGEIKENLASLLNDVATQAEEERTILSSDTECDTSSSGGREVKNIISSAIEYRDTVATLTATASAVHQQQQGVAPEQEPKQRASSAEEASSWGPPPAAEPPKVVKKFEAAIKPTENGQGKKESDSVSKISIAERLALLKQNGETEWKKRVPRASPGDELASNGNKDAGYKPLQQSKSMPGSARGILAEKLNQLDVAASDWKKRVGPKDAVDFSVAGRMGVETGTPSPFMSPAREKRTPKPARFKSKKERNNRTSSKESDGGNSSTPESPSKEAAVTIKLPPLARSISAPESQPVIKVPSMTDHLDQFFTSTAETITMESEEIGTLPDAEQHTLLVSHRRTVQVQKRRNATRNPLKTLAARTDIVQEYQEVRTGAAEREMKRLNVEKLAKNSNLAVEALAGLASKEDFTAVSLKKPSGDPVGTLLPFRDLMLLQVKGRRHVQTRLVEPVASKVNQGDSYVLVTPNAVYNWLGKFSNVIERTRSAEIALQISQRKDLGCLKAAGNVFTIDEAKSLGSASHKKAFWKLLGVQEGCGEALKAGHPDEDEEYENVISETNKIWMVEDDELIPVEKYWGSVPKIEVLAPNKVLVFDFGSEVYIWNGKNATGDVRRFAAEFVQDELWQTVDYSDCDISPIGDTAVKVRPEWAILGKLSQHMETALFREKFLDWPEFSRVIRVKRKGETEVDGSIEVLPCDANKMAAQEWTEPDFELESSHIGRGEHYFDHETRRHFEIATTAVEVWHIEEFEYHEIPDASMGQFHEGDSYVVRWNYSITVSGRELSGAPSKHGTVGRDRCAYFFWQGSQSSLSEQGAAALLTVELDKEQGPQVRVVQGSELAVFRGLFNGHMAIHRGHRGQQQETSPKWRLFVTVTGAIDKESCLLEVAPSVRQLRSRSSLILLDTKSDKAFVWHGNQSHKHTKAAALRAARQMHLHPEFHLGKEAEIEEINEGDKQIEFFRGLGGNNTNLYDSLPPSNEPCDLKMFHFSSASGAFTVQEMLSATRTKEPAEAFPFVQRDLYELSQPALVLVDAGCVLWLWQGWWPREDGSGGDDSTGSGAIRWQAERRAAMQTAVNYWTATRGPDARLSANLVWAGLESVEFVSLFPDWQNKDDATESNMQDGRKPGETLSVEDELARLTQSTYPPAQLLQRPLPDGVDPTKLEEYLSSEHFEELLGMTKEEFTELPTWKQTSVKKQVGLF